MEGKMSGQGVSVADGPVNTAGNATKPTHDFAYANSLEERQQKLLAKAPEDRNQYEEAQIRTNGRILASFNSKDSDNRPSLSEDMLFEGNFFTGLFF